MEEGGQKPSLIEPSPANREREREGGSDELDIYYVAFNDVELKLFWLGVGKRVQYMK